LELFFYIYRLNFCTLSPLSENGAAKRVDHDPCTREGVTANATRTCRIAHRHIKYKRQKYILDTHKMATYTIIHDFTDTSVPLIGPSSFASSSSSSYCYDYLVDYSLLLVASPFSPLLSPSVSHVVDQTEGWPSPIPEKTDA
jgi:hypothetical protein